MKNQRKPTMLQILQEDTKVCLSREDERGVQKIARKYRLPTALVRYMLRNGLITGEGMSEMDAIVLSFCRKSMNDEILATYIVSEFDPEIKYMISYFSSFSRILRQNVARE